MKTQPFIQRPQVILSIWVLQLILHSALLILKLTYTPVLNWLLVVLSILIIIANVIEIRKESQRLRLP